MRNGELYALTKSGGGDPVLETLSVTPSLTSQTITPSEGVDGFDEVDVAAITKELLATLDADFVARNIRSGVDLFGLVGTLSGAEGWEMGNFSALTKRTEDTKICDIFKPNRFIMINPVFTGLSYGDVYFAMMTPDNNVTGNNLRNRHSMRYTGSTSYSSENKYKEDIETARDNHLYYKDGAMYFKATSSYSLHTNPYSYLWLAQK